MITIEESIDSADWIKQAWDLPPYKSAEFMAQFGHDLDHFRALPVYRYAVEQGRIVDDEWVHSSAKYDKDQPRDKDGQWTSGYAATPEVMLNDSPVGGALHSMALLSMNGVKKDAPLAKVLDTLVSVSHGQMPRLQYVHEVGKEMQVRPCSDRQRLTQHRCYNNSIDMMMQTSFEGQGNKHEYVEGVITEHGVPLAHAWNRVGSDKHPRYIDYTVPAGDHKYKGVYIPRKVLIPVASSGAFSKGYGEGIIGTILAMKDAKKRENYLRLIREANQ
jgi:hypothetical protein